MARMNQTSHATTGFVTTLVLTCAFAILATALWTPRHDSGTAVATDTSLAVPSAVITHPSLDRDTNP